MQTLKGWMLAATITAAAMAAPHAAQAEGIGVFSPGVLYSAVWGRAPTDGFGLELSYAYHPRNTSTFSVGAFTQAQANTDGSFRIGGGAQVGWQVFGLELGWAQRTGNDQFAGAGGVHIAPYLSVGVVLVALRFTLPLADEAPNHPTVLGAPEMALTVGLKLPFRTHGRLPAMDCGCPHRH